ncbi:MAG: Rdx family protein [Chloroflexi bacterium]|nr:Rdx family protein [Chloroflexota bacterium]
MRNYQHIIARFELVMGSKGVFDVKVDDTLLYSKKEMGRHAEPGEILALFEAFIEPGVERYPRDSI